MEKAVFSENLRNLNWWRRTKYYFIINSYLKSYDYARRSIPIARNVRSKQIFFFFVLLHTGLMKLTQAVSDISRPPCKHDRYKAHSSSLSSSRSFIWNGDHVANRNLFLSEVILRFDFYIPSRVITTLFPLIALNLVKSLKIHFISVRYSYLQNI